MPMSEYEYNSDAFEWILWTRNYSNEFELNSNKFELNSNNFNLNWHPRNKSTKIGTIKIVDI